MLRIRDTRKWSDVGVRGLRFSLADNWSRASRPTSRKRLGEPFFTTKGQAGTGLGLWVTRSILSRYGGNLQLRSSTSKNGHGTVFSIFLPTNMRPLAVACRPAPAGVSRGVAYQSCLQRSQAHRSEPAAPVKPLAAERRLGVTPRLLRCCGRLALARIFLGDGLRHDIVVIHLHMKTSPALGHRRQAWTVTEHFRHRNLGANNRG